MEGRRNEPGFDENEIDKLIGEATSGNSRSEETVMKSVSMNGVSSPIFRNSSRGGPLNEKLQGSRSFDDRKVLVNKTQGSPVKMVPSEEQKFVDEQSFRSAFAKMSLDNASPLAKCNNVPNHSSLLDHKYANGVKQSLSSMGLPMRNVPSLHSANSVPGCFDAFSMANAVQESSDFIPQGLNRMPVNYCQNPPTDNFSASSPQTQGFQAFRCIPDAAVPGMEYPLRSEQEQYLANIQSPVPFLHSQQLNQPQMGWRNLEQEQYYNTMYIRQLRNQLLEAQQPIHVNGNFAAKAPNQNMRQMCFEVPRAHQFQQLNQDRYWKGFGVTQGLNQSQTAMHVLNRMAKQNFQEKMLARSQGLNTHKASTFGPGGESESLSHLNQQGKVLSNAHLHHILSSPNAEYFQYDHLNSFNLPLDSESLRDTSFRPHSQRFHSLDEVTGRIYQMSKDQHGCRFLQRTFSEGNRSDVEKIFVEVIDHIVELMTDPFGNYLVQKLLEVCDANQRMQIIRHVTRKAGDLIRISCDMHGTRAVQKVIETLQSPEEFSMVVSSLRPGIVTLMKDMNGNHVAQRCLQCLLPEYSEFLFEATTVNCVELATDRHGCCVLQKCLCHCEGEQRRRLVSEITSNALILSQDPFGNYVVQYIFDLPLPWATLDILDQLEGHFGDLSMQKYSSNVVEKCLKHASEERCTLIIRELINNPRLDQIMQDPYGNYVIQAALHKSKGHVHAALVDAIKPHVLALRTSPYGKKVLSCSSLKK